MSDSELEVYLYKISQTVNVEYDVFDSAIVAAHTENEAARMHPDGYVWNEGGWLLSDGSVDDWPSWSWTTPDNVKVEIIGIASKGIEPGQVLLASKN